MAQKDPFMVVCSLFRFVFTLTLFYFLSIEIKNEKKKTNAFDGLKQKAKNVFGVNNTIFDASRILL